jgi:hypothetical protein
MMKKNRRRIIFATLFILSTASFNRIHGNENIRNVQFLSIFMMGVFAGLLIREFIDVIQNKQTE